MEPCIYCSFMEEVAYIFILEMWKKITLMGLWELPFFVSSEDGDG